MELQIRRVCVADAIATYGPVAIRVIRSARTEMADIDEAKEVLDELAERWPVIGVLGIVYHGAPVPSGPVRRYASQVFGSYGERLLMSHVLVGLGFWAAAGRMAVRVITALLGDPSPIESTVEAGAARLADELIGVDPTKLVAAHDELLARMNAAEASVA